MPRLCGALQLYLLPEHDLVGVFALEPVAAVQFVDDGIRLRRIDGIERKVSPDTVQRIVIGAAAVRRRIPAEEREARLFRAGKRVHFARTDRRGIAAEEGAAAGVVSDRIQRAALLPAGIQDEVAGVFAAHLFVPLAALFGVEPAEEIIAAAHGLREHGFASGGDFGRVAAVQRAAAQFILHRIDDGAPFCVQHDVFPLADEDGDGLARIVGREIPALEGRARLLRDGELEGAALQRKGVFRRGKQAAAVQPIVDLVFVRDKLRGKFAVFGNFAGKSDGFPVAVGKADKIVAGAGRLGRGEPIVFPDLEDGASHRDAENFFCGGAAAREKEGENRRDGADERREARPEGGGAAGAARLYGRLRGGILPDAVIQRGEREGKVRGERGKLRGVGADDAAFPFGYGARGDARRLRDRLLPLSPVFAGGGDGAAQPLGAERARIRFPVFGYAEQLFQRNAEKGSRFAQKGEVGFADAALPLGYRLQVHAQLFGKFSLRAARRLAQLFQPFPKLFAHSPAPRRAGRPPLFSVFLPYYNIPPCKMQGAKNMQKAPRG